MTSYMKLASVALLAFATLTGPARASSPPATQKAETAAPAAKAKPAAAAPAKTTAAPAPAKATAAPTQAKATPAPAQAKATAAPAQAKATAAPAQAKATAAPAQAKATAAPAPAKAADPVASQPQNGQPNAKAVTSLANLMQGNSRFVAGTLGHPHQDSGIRSALASGQHPHAIVLSCSDSRVPPEVVFDQGLGDLFVVRAAGHVLDHATVSSVEYAVEHLHAPLILVLGHQACGAVKAALTTAPEKAGSKDLEYMIASIRPAVAPLAAAAKSDPMIEKPVRAQVEATITALMRRSAIVRGHVGKGQLTVVPSVYKLATGEVEMWDAPAAEPPVAEGK